MLTDAYDGGDLAGRRRVFVRVVFEREDRPVHLHREPRKGIVTELRGFIDIACTFAVNVFDRNSRFMFGGTKNNALNGSFFISLPS